MRVTSIHIYPIKGTRAVNLPEAMVEPWGLAGDRRLAVVDEAGRIATQRDYPRLTQVRSAYADGDLILAGAGLEPITAPLTQTQDVEVRVFGTTVRASHVDDAADGWLSIVLGRPVRLLWLDDPAQRPVNPRHGNSGDRVMFADACPLLLCLSASLDRLNDWLIEAGSPEWPLPMTRFRPNVVVRGGHAFVEDDWLGRRLAIGETVFRAPVRSSRCVVSATDQVTGERGREPLRTLARHRHIGQGLLFGIYLVPDVLGKVSVGDVLSVLD